MVKIADIMRLEAPSILDGQPLPPIIDSHLQLAVSIFDLNKISFRQNIKRTFLLAGGVGGVGLIVASLESILNVGIWAQVSAWAVGGVAGGLAGPLGVVGGVGVCIMIMWRLLSKMSPHQRVIKCHTIVTKAIDKWVKDGSKGDKKELPKKQKSEWL